MIGTLITLGLGATVFKLGMNAGKRISDGASTWDSIAKVPGDAKDMATYAYDKVTGFFRKEDKDKK